jgi:hypothetical protein
MLDIFHLIIVVGCGDILNHLILFERVLPRMLAILVTMASMLSWHFVTLLLFIQVEHFLITKLLTFSTS